MNTTDHIRWPIALVFIIACTWLFYVVRKGEQKNDPVEVSEVRRNPWLLKERRERRDRGEVPDLFVPREQRRSLQGNQGDH